MSKRKLVRRRAVIGRDKLPCFKWFVAGGPLIRVELTEGGQNLLAHINMQSLRDRGIIK